jgi:hypothetical protein
VKIVDNMARKFFMTPEKETGPISPVNIEEDIATESSGLNFNEEAPTNIPYDS